MSSRLLKFFTTGWLLVAISLATGTRVLRAEQAVQQAADATEVSQEASDELARRRALKKAMLRKLTDKLTRKDGKFASFIVFTPLDLTQKNHGAQLADILAKSIRSYGAMPVTISETVVQSLTLEELRKQLIHAKADILVASSLKPASFDAYLFDSRTPYYIYAYSEPIPPEARMEVNAGAIPVFAKTAMRKLLFRYLQNQFFEIPRSEDSPVIKSEIPRWIASTESLQLMQHDLASTVYASLSYGAALSKGADHSWISNIFSLEVGTKISQHLYVEGAFDAFSYNALVGSLKYVLDNREHTFGLVVGAGLAMVTPHFSFTTDPTLTLGNGGIFLVPTISVLLPLADIYFKGEVRAYISGGKSVLTVMPGFLMNF